MELRSPIGARIRHTQDWIGHHEDAFGESRSPRHGGDPSPCCHRHVHAHRHGMQMDREGEHWTREGNSNAGDVGQERCSLAILCGM